MSNLSYVPIWNPNFGYGLSSLDGGPLIHSYYENEDDNSLFALDGTKIRIFRNSSLCLDIANNTNVVLSSCEIAADWWYKDQVIFSSGNRCIKGFQNFEAHGGQLTEIESCYNRTPNMQFVFDQATLTVALNANSKCGLSNGNIQELVGKVPGPSNMYQSAYGGGSVVHFKFNENYGQQIQVTTKECTGVADTVFFFGYLEDMSNSDADACSVAFRVISPCSILLLEVTMTGFPSFTQKYNLSGISNVPYILAIDTPAISSSLAVVLGSICGSLLFIALCATGWIVYRRYQRKTAVVSDYDSKGNPTISQGLDDEIAKKPDDIEKCGSSTYDFATETVPNATEISSIGGPSATYEINEDTSEREAHYGKGKLEERLERSKLLDVLEDSNISERHPSLWTCREVCNWIHREGFGEELERKFRDLGCDGSVLKSLSANRESCSGLLLQDFGIKDLRLRMLLVDRICSVFEEVDIRLEAPPEYS